MSHSLSETDKVGFFGNPLDKWGNDDLMLKAETRKEIKEDRPEAFRVVDWPELRALFEKIDEKSKLAKRGIRKSGARAVALAASGLVLAEFNSLVSTPGSTQAQLLGFVAAAIMLFGICHGLYLILDGKSRNKWLLTRLQAERLRQLNFQFFLSHLPLVVRAMRDDDALAELSHAKRASLARFKDTYLQAAQTEFRATLDDIAYERVWHNDTWESTVRNVSKLEPQEDAVQLLETLRRLRFTVQKHYSQLALGSHQAAPKFRAKFLKTASDIFVAAMVISSLVLATSQIFGWSETARMLVAVTAMFAAAVAAFGTLNDGLRYDEDASRMRWYLASLEALEKSYDRHSSRGHARILGELEVLAYREMRDFLKTHYDARFILK